MKERFTLNRLVNRKIVKETFNSDLDCKCQIASNYSLGKEEFVFKYQSGDTKREKEHSSIIDEKGNMIDNFLPQPNFKYYQNYDFHRLRTGLKGHKIFSLLHTNICKICKICKILLII